MFLHDLLERDADGPALIADGVTRTFGELRDRAARTGSVVEGHERVAVMADNCGAWIDCYYGLPRAGKLLVAVNQRLSPDEQRALIADAGATVVITDRPVDLGVPAVPLAEWEERLAAAPHTPAAPTDAAWLLFTSGTTARPKPVTLTHRSLLAAATNTALARPVAPDDVFLTPFPLCHVAGYNVFVFHLHGRPAVVLPRFRADELAAAVHEHHVTVCSLAPTMVVDLLALDVALPALRTITYGASPMPPDVARRAIARLGVTLREGYGMTELSGNAVFDGVPGPLAEVRLAADGEILVRGDQVAGDVDADGWLHTGDLGRWDDGRLHVVDRKKDIVITGGENVSSREVEDVLHDHPAVAAVAVIGVPDPRWGEAVCAVVVRRAPVEADELVAHVKARLAGFKQPRHVVFVDELPTTPTGKVRKQDLRDAVVARIT